MILKTDVRYLPCNSGRVERRQSCLASQQKEVWLERFLDTRHLVTAALHTFNSAFAAFSFSDNTGDANWKYLGNSRDFFGVVDHIFNLSVDPSMVA